MRPSDDGAAVEDRERTRVDLVIAAVLAAVAGCVDAAFFGRVAEVFPANQSGNAVLLGMGIGDGSAGQTWRPAVAILGFGAGVTAAVILGSRLRRRRRAPLLVALEIVFLVPLTILFVNTSHPEDLDGVQSAAIIIVTAMAMGLQTEVIGRVAGVSVATTYQSGAIARIGELAAQRNRAVALPRVAVLGVVLGGYVAGAALGAAMGDWGGALCVPVATLTLLTITLTVAESRSSSFVV